MAGIGQIKVIDFIDAIVASRTKDVSNGAAPIAYGKANFFVDVEAITRTTGSVTIQLNWKSANGVVLNITANLTALIAVGINEFTLDPQFTGATDAIPEPSEAVVVFVGDTSLFTARIYMISA